MKKKEDGFSKNKIYVHENPYTIFWHEDNQLFMFEKYGKQVINLNMVIQDFINENKNSKNIRVLEEVFFKKIDLQNIELLIKYNINAIRSAFSGFFYDLTDLFFSDLIKDASIEFYNKIISNKYQFIFKNLGFGLKKKAIKIIEKDLLESKRFFKPVKYSILKSYYLLKISPRDPKITLDWYLGIKLIKHKSNEIFQSTKNDRFIFLTENSYNYLSKFLFSEFVEKDFNTKIKIHADPNFYQQQYFEKIFTIDKSLFIYQIVKPEVKDVLKERFYLPELHQKY